MPMPMPPTRGSEAIARLLPRLSETVQVLRDVL
jgi:hypothetical protein